MRATYMTKVSWQADFCSAARLIKIMHLKRHSPSAGFYLFSGLYMQKVIIWLLEKGRSYRRRISCITKSAIKSLDFWNMGFGAYNPNTQQVDDQVISDNGDGRKVLATVAFSMQEFMIERANMTIFFTGSAD